MTSNSNQSVDPVARFGEYMTQNEFTFTVFYRGHWCPFCQSYLRTLQSLQPKISAAGGKIIAITAEVEEHLAAMRKVTGYDGEVIVDTENKIAAEMKRRSKLDVAISPKAGYEHGMAQPAVLVMKKDGTVLYDWAIVPSLMNIGGAKDRPDLLQVWENVEAKMNDKPVVHKNIKLQTFTQVMWQKIFG